MANPEHLAVLERGVAAWNDWKVGRTMRMKNLRGANLANARLHGINFQGVDLEGANLHCAKLHLAFFVDANLASADLSGAEMHWANFTNADLRNANLNKADLSVATFADAAKLAGADFNGAKLLGTIFSGVNLGEAIGLDSLRHWGRSTIDHQTIAKSGPLPIVFLRGCGLPETLIDYLPSLLNEPFEFYSCFISYSHADKSFARRLHDTLQGRGIRCWLDEHQLLPGHDIYDQVDRGIRLWDKVLLCCSKASLSSWWVDNEIGKAFAKEQSLMKQRGKKTLALIPLNLDGQLFVWQDGKADEIRRRLASDFTNWKRNNAKFEKEIEKVVKALRAGEGSRQKPPKPLL